MKASRFLCLLLLCALTLSMLAGCAKQQTPQEETRWVDVTLSGGTGKARVHSPAALTVSGEKMTLRLIWSSSNYDYMVVSGEKLLPVSTDPGSTFDIPVTALDVPFPAIADTTAMSTPHEIEYTLTVHSSQAETQPTQAESASQTAGMTAAQEISPELHYTGSAPLQYAKEFTADFYEDGYTLLSIPTDGRQFLLVPEGKTTPEQLAAGIIPLQLPLQNLYLAASAAMDMFISLDALECIRFSGTRENDWYLEPARTAMSSGAITYAGNYAAPDYERICSSGCSLAIENTMLYHTPEAREQLERFGVPVLVEQSSHELTPQGRMEWIKLYGLLTGKTAEAEAAFDAQIASLEASQAEPSGKSAAFFYITSTGMVNVRASQDYLAELVRLAGGVYVPEADGTGTVSMQREAFYQAARDADFLIYNSSIDGALQSAADLVTKDSMLADFQAVKSGNLYCTSRNFYQSSMELGAFAQDLHRMFAGENDNLNFLYRLE